MDFQLSPALWTVDGSTGGGSLSDRLHEEDVWGWNTRHVLSPGTGNPDIYRGSWDPGKAVPAAVGSEGHRVADARGELVAKFVGHGIPT
jgi:hypothetical protein